MNKWIAAAASVLMTATGVALAVHSVQACDEPLAVPAQVENRMVQQLRESYVQSPGVPWTQNRAGETRYGNLDLIETENVLAQAARGQVFFGQSQPGTWQIVTAKDMVLLLNSASGATFRLVQEDGSARWQPIEGQFPKVEAVRTVEPRRIEWPATPRRIPMPPEVDRPAVQDLRAMEELVRSFDNLITSLEARLRKETSEAEKAKIKARLEDLRADRKKAAEDLEKARAEDADQQHPAPRGR